MYGHGHKMHGHGHKMYGGSHSDMEGGAFADGSDMGVTGVGLVVRVLVNRQAMPIVRRENSSAAAAAARRAARRRAAAAAAAAAGRARRRRRLDFWAGAWDPVCY
jgi:hypothetical protein